MTNLDALRQTIKDCRGKNYHDLVRAFFSIAGDAMVAEARAFPEFTPLHVVYLSLRFGINFKATCEYLEERRVIRSGVYAHLTKNLGAKVRDLHSKARAQWPEIEIWQPEVKP